MAKCGCGSSGGGSCSCRIVGGSGIIVTGAGTDTSPYVVVASGQNIAGTIVAEDSSTVELSRTGSGSTGDPYVLRAELTANVSDLSDLQGTAPSNGNTIIYNGTKWVYAAPGTPVGAAVVVGAGLVGNGSLASPVRLNGSTFGGAELNTFGSDSTVGARVYTDANGLVRAAPTAANVGTTNPNHYTGRLFFHSTNKRLFVSDGTAWQALTIDGTHVTSGLVAAARIAPLDAAKVTTGAFSADRIPSLNASKINAGTLGVDRIPNLNASKITEGTLNADRIPVLDSSKINSGVLNSARIPPTLTGNRTFTGNIQVDSVGSYFNGLSVSGMLSSGNFQTGQVYSQELIVAGTGSTNSISGRSTFWIPNTGAGRFRVVRVGTSGDDDHDLSIGTDTQGGYVSSTTTYYRTYSNSANLYVTGNGRLGRATSSRRYKEDIVPAGDMPNVLDLDPKTWIDKAQKQRTLAAIADGTIRDGWSVDTLPRYYGVIAEEVADLGLDGLYTVNDEGLPESVNYDRIGVALIPIVRALKDQVADLTERLVALENK